MNKRTFYFFLFLTVLSLIVTSCKKEDTNENDNKTEKESENTSTAQLSAMVKGSLFEASSGFVIAETSNNFIDFYGVKIGTEEMMGFTIGVGIAPGTYDIGMDNDNEFHAFYNASNDEIYSTDTENAKGTLTIETINFNSEDELIQLTGTFSFVAYNEDVYPADSIAVMQGKINFK